MSEELLFDIRLMIDSKEHGCRIWPAVPRKGDMVSVLIKGAPVLRYVQRVVWGVDKQSLEGSGRNLRIGVDVYLSKDEP